MAYKSRKLRRAKPRKTVRGHRSSTAGKILPPLDVTGKHHLKEFEKRIKKGPLTIIMVYADWCGHCHRMKPHFDAASKSPSRSIQSVKVDEKMLDSVNDYMSRNNGTSPISVSGYPSILVVDNKGEKVTDINPVQDTKVMTDVMNKSASLAKESGLIDDASEIGLESSGVVGSISPRINSASRGSASRNLNVGEEGLKGSLGSLGSELRSNANGASARKSANANKLNSVSMNKSKAPSVEKAAIGDESTTVTNGMSTTINSLKTSKVPKDVEEQSMMLTNMTSAIEPSKNAEIDVVAPPLATEDYNKMSGGACPCAFRQGGSLLGSLSRAAYTLAPAAALIATASIVSRKNKDKSHHKRAKKTRRHGKHRK